MLKVDGVAEGRIRHHHGDFPRVLTQQLDFGVRIRCPGLRTDIAIEGREPAPDSGMCGRGKSKAGHQRILPCCSLADRLFHSKHEADGRIAHGHARALAGKKAVQHLPLESFVNGTEIAKNAAIFQGLQFLDGEGKTWRSRTNHGYFHAGTISVMPTVRTLHASLGVARRASTIRPPTSLCHSHSPFACPRKLGSPPSFP